ncbi:MAG: DUF1573 domain-containing protein [bacterium]
MKTVFSRALGIFFLSVNSLSAVKMDSVFWDVGSIDITSEREKTVEIFNEDSRPVEVAVRVTCDCIEADPAKTVIPANGRKKVRIIFNPSGEKGKIRHSVYFEFSRGDVPFVNYMVTADVEEKFDVYLFYDENCKSCRKVLKKLRALKENYKFEIKEFPVEKPVNFELLRFIENLYGKKEKKFPVVFVGATGIAGAEEILEGAEDALRNFSPHKSGIQNFHSEKVRSGLLGEFKSLKLLPVAAAALSDGVNPCAFAGIIFLVSYLSFVLKKTSGEVLTFGIGYSSGVCIFYFIFGLGILQFLKALFLVEILGRIFFLLLAIGTAVLAVFSFLDAARFKKGGEISLKVPDKIAAKMRDTAEHFLNKKGLFFYSFLIGGIVSSFELICTGQIYLPTISYIVSVTKFSPASVFALFLYSVLFTLPLFIVFVFVFRGRSSVGMITFVKKNVFKAKILMGFVFTAFSVYLFMNVFR